MRSDVDAYLHRSSEVPGWFFEEDFRVFDWLLERQALGDLLEIGAFQGASAILLGLHRRSDETVTVCDLFGPPEPEDNRSESEPWYRGLTRDSFEQNYTRFVKELPVIVQGSSLSILEHVRPATCRFVHIDGCHLYDYARADIEASRTILQEHGVIACDDWRTQHTPGVTMAVLERVAAGQLHPIAITQAKFYGSFNPSLAAELRRAVMVWASDESEMALDVQSIRGVDWVRLHVPNPPTRSPAQRALARLSRRVRRTARLSP